MAITPTSDRPSKTRRRHARGAPDVEQPRALAPEATEPSQGPRAPRLRRVLNVRLLLGTIAALAVLFPAVHFWHARQAQRTAKALLVEADRREAEGEWRAAADYLYRYLRLRPDDLAIQLRLAKTYDRSVATHDHKTRAVELLYRAVGISQSPEFSSETHALRLTLANRLTELRRFAEAAQQAEAAISGPNDAAAVRALALALYGQAQAGLLAERNGDSQPTTRESYAAWLASQPVGVVLERALRLNGGDLQLSILTATVYRDEPHLLPAAEREAAEVRTQRARAIMDALRNANPQEPRALLACFAFLRKEDRETAQRDLDQALAIAPDLPEALLAAALHYHERGKQAASEGLAEAAQSHWRTAANYYRGLLSRSGMDSAAVYLGLGEVLLAAGEVEDAIAAWQAGMRAAHENPTLQLRLAEVLLQRSRLPEAEEALRHADAVIHRHPSSLAASARRRFARSRTVLQSHLYRKRGESLRAAAELERLLTKADARQDAMVWTSLVAAYTEAGEWDRAGAACEQLAALAPSAENHLVAAVAWLRAGAPQQALRHYERIADESLEVRVGKLEARFALLLSGSLPDAQVVDEFRAELQSVAQALEDPSPPISDAWRVALLYADLARTTRNPHDAAQAMTQLQRAEERYAQNEQFATRLVLAYEYLGQRSEADRVLQTLWESETASTAAVAPLCASRLLRLRGNVAQARDVLQDTLARDPQDAAGVALELASLLVGTGQFTPALEVLSKLPQEVADLRTTRLAAEIALSIPMELAGVADQAEYRARVERWAARVEEWEDRLRALEGVEGTNWRCCRARRLVALSVSADDLRLGEAAGLQVEVQKRRPHWFMTHLVRGLIAERRMNDSDAIEAYAAALRFGGNHVFVYQRLAAAYYRTGRFADADRLLDRMPEYIPLSRDFSELAINVAIQLREFSEAAAIADRGVERRPTDPLAWIWLGQTHLLQELPQGARASTFGEAEAAFRRAIELSRGEDLRAWSALLTLMLQMGDKRRAQETLEQLATQVKFAHPAQQDLVLAQGYELMGEWEQAGQHYAAAQTKKPDDIHVQAKAAEFYVKRNDEGKAEHALRQVLRLDAQAESARHMLAVLLAARGSEAAWAEIRQLLASSGDRISYANERLRAVLLFSRGGPRDLDEARDALENLIRQPRTVTPGDRLLLASVYARQARLETRDDEKGAIERLRKFAAARKQFSYLVHTLHPEPAHQAAYVDLLLSEGNVDEAARQVEALRAAAPDFGGLLGVEVRVLHARGDADGAERRLARWADEQIAAKQPPAATFLAVGETLTQFGLHARAEEWYRKACGYDAALFAPLALALAMQNDPQKTEEAISLCLAERDEAHALGSVVALISVLIASGAHQDADRFEAAWGQSLASHADNPQLLAALADLRLAQGRCAEAEPLYRRALKVQPNQAPALNNLAIALIEQDGRAVEAEPLIDRALELAGEQPFLLDTKGVVLLALGRAADAVPYFERAAALGEERPLYRFHHAAALWKANAAARVPSLWRKLDQTQLRKQATTRFDRQLLDELSLALAKAS